MYSLVHFATFYVNIETKFKKIVSHVRVKGQITLTSNESKKDGLCGFT